uniref:Uncharacterized protein n=1 Tax=Meloidogyne enterolobii TaxID=390850 RepID=A0A6V7V6T5_MELEN|nr:unnamed protein product [Meloidogyne enterolobii]
MMWNLKQNTYFGGKHRFNLFIFLKCKCQKCTLYSIQEWKYKSFLANVVQQATIPMTLIQILVEVIAVEEGIEAVMKKFMEVNME